MISSTASIWTIPKALECVLFLLFVCSMDDRYPFGWRAMGLAAGLISYEMFVRYLHLLFILDFPLCLIGYVTYLIFAKKSTKQEYLYVSCIALLCFEVGKIVTNDLLMQPFYPQLSSLVPLAVTALNFTLVISVDAITMFAIRRWTFLEGVQNLSWPQCLSILLPILPFAFLRSRSYAYSVQDVALYQDTVLTLLMLLGSTIVIIVANAINVSSAVRKTELLQMESLLKKQHEQYAMKKSAAEAINHQYHDIKYYLNALEASRGDGQMKEFIDAVNHSIAPYETSIETGNEVVNVILSDKITRCTAHHIRLVPYVDASRLDFISSFDICALLGNAIDNAIEASMEVTSETREISLKVSYARKLVVMRLSNNYVGKLIGTGRWPGTSKPDKEQHGYGLGSIDAVVTKYGGNMGYDASDGVFTLNIIIPLPT